MTDARVGSVEHFFARLRAGLEVVHAGGVVRKWHFVVVLAVERPQRDLVHDAAATGVVGDAAVAGYQH